MTQWELLRPYLPAAWVTALAALPSAVGDRIQEIRLRSDTPVTVSLPRGERYLAAGGITAVPQGDGFFCSHQQLEDCFLSFCDGSVYAHQWELQQGYIAARGGLRVGVAGTAVTRDGGVCSVQKVTALCVRLPRCVAGCARPLMPWVAGDSPTNTLLVGPPSCGKTTLLRDLATQLAAGRHRVTVVDERGELAASGMLQGCDVLRGYPKAVGVAQAVRCLAPDYILLDELGGAAEMQAVSDCAHAGVAVVATLHGHNPKQMERQPFVEELLRRRVFARWVFLRGRETPGEIDACYIPEVTAHGVDWRIVTDGCGSGDGGVCRPSSATAGGVFGNLRPPIAGTVAGDELYGTTHRRPMATVGAI